MNGSRTRTLSSVFIAAILAASATTITPVARDYCGDVQIKIGRDGIEGQVNGCHKVP